MNLRIKFKKKKKFYFITFESKQRKDNTTVKRNDVIFVSPIEFMALINDELKNNTNSRYYDFILINSLEITKEEYLKYKDKF